MRAIAAAPVAAVAAAVPMAAPRDDFEWVLANCREIYAEMLQDADPEARKYVDIPIDDMIIRSSTFR